MPYSVNGFDFKEILFGLVSLGGGRNDRAGNPVPTPHPADISPLIFVAYFVGIKMVLSFSLSLLF